MVNLKSEMGIDYSHLEKLLKAAEWKEADSETAELMLKASNREEERWLDVESIQRFPCDDLRIINALWMQYSGDRFGFDVQMRIYQDCGAPLDGTYPNGSIWNDLIKRTGAVGMGLSMWPQEGESATDFPLSVPPGHLPCTALDCCSDRIWGWWVCNPQGAIALFCRARACGL